jgi:hypothetical protein
MATDYKGYKDVQVTTMHGPKAKNGGAAPRQILDIQLF